MNATSALKQSFSRTKVVWGLVVLAIGLAIYTIWQMDTSPTTDDAYAYADTIAVVPEVSGRLVALNVKDNQAVAKGAVLFQIDDRSYQDALKKAEGTLEELDAQIAQTKRTIKAQTFNADAAAANIKRAEASAKQAEEVYQRKAPLLRKGYVSAQEVGDALANVKSSSAALVAAKSQAASALENITDLNTLLAKRKVMQADVSQAKLNLEHTIVRAPFNGRVIGLSTTLGQYVSPNHAVFTLADNQDWYVIANFRETQLDQMKAGTPATVYLMSNTSKVFPAVVESIGYGVTPTDGGISSNGAMPNVQRSLNWVHVAQRFPVRIRVLHPDPDLFRIGASAVAVIKK